MRESFFLYFMIKLNFICLINTGYIPIWLILLSIFCPSNYKTSDLMMTANLLDYKIAYFIWCTSSKSSSSKNCHATKNIWKTSFMALLLSNGIHWQENWEITCPTKKGSSSSTWTRTWTRKISSKILTNKFLICIVYILLKGNQWISFQCQTIELGSRAP